MRADAPRVEVCGKRASRVREAADLRAAGVITDLIVTDIDDTDLDVTVTL